MGLPRQSRREMIDKYVEECSQQTQQELTKLTSSKEHSTNEHEHKGKLENPQPRHQEFDAQLEISTSVHSMGDNAPATPVISESQNVLTINDKLTTIPYVTNNSAFSDGSLLGYVPKVKENEQSTPFVTDSQVQRILERQQNTIWSK